MRLFCPCLALIPALLLSLPGAAAARTSDDTPEEIAKELSEKIAKAYRKAAEAQRKAAEKAARRDKEEREDQTEVRAVAHQRGSMVWPPRTSWEGALKNFSRRACARSFSACSD